jgi:hypothetical protein
VIDLRFVQGFGFSSWAIEDFSAGRFSHVDAIVPRGGIPDIPWMPYSLVGERSDKVGGKPPGLNARPYGYESVKKAVIFHLPSSLEQTTAFWAFLYSQEGHAYDKPSIWAYAFNANWHRWGTYVCSAAILNALQSADRMRSLYSPFWKVTPVALANLVSADGATWEDDAGLLTAQ